MTYWILVAGHLLVFVAVAALVGFYRTAMLGLNILNLFSVWAATMSAFFMRSIFDLDSVVDSAELEYVLSYSIAGLLAMTGGIFLGWRSLLEPGRTNDDRENSLLKTDRFTPQLGLHTFIVGSVAEITSLILSVSKADVATLSTAIDSLAALDRLGLFILLINALRTDRWQLFMSVLGAFMTLAILSSMITGSTFLRINALIPLAAIWFAFRGLKVRTILFSLVAALILTPLVTAWLNTRGLIREGYLDALPVLNRVGVFFDAFLSNINFPDADSTLQTILTRVDMTDTLVEQVRYQPVFEPYAHGDTVWSSFYTLIPRLLWSDKPVVAGGSEFVARFTGMFREADDLTSVGMPYPFELYANGGAIAVVVGLGVIGYIGAKMELSLLRSQKNLGAFWASGLTTIVICDGGQRTDIILPSLLSAAITAYVLGWILERIGLKRAR